MARGPCSPTIGSRFHRRDIEGRGDTPDCRSGRAAAARRSDCCAMAEVLNTATYLGQLHWPVRGKKVGGKQLLKLSARKSSTRMDRATRQSRPRLTHANRRLNHAVDASPEAGVRALGIDQSAAMADRFANHFAGVSTHIKAPKAIQPKLDISRPGDAGEREADRVAEEVMRMPDGLCRQADHHGGWAGPPAVQGACTCGGRSISDEGERVRRSPDLSLPTIGERVPTSQIERNPFAGSEPVEEISGIDVAAGQDQAIATQRTTAGGATAQTAVPATAGSGLAASIDSASRGGGQPLSLEARRFMEPRFGHDFGAVRIHSDRTAGDLARQLQACAFTSGNRIFFAPGEFQPDRTRGKRLLAHELTHVVQQSMGGRGVRRQIQRAKSGCLNCRPYCSYGSAPLSSYNCAASRTGPTTIRALPPRRRSWPKDRASAVIRPAIMSAW